MYKRQGKGESIIRIAAELLECPVAFVTSDFHLQNTHDTSGYLVLNPFCNEDSFNLSLIHILKILCPSRVKS